MSGDGDIRPSERLWTPWRMAYVGGTARSSDCVFCAAASGDDDVASLVVYRGTHSFVILNLYPYNTGHLMVVPYEHVSDPAGLSVAARAEIAELTASFVTGLRLVMGCEGLNVGMNLGSAAGAGIADHLHQHLVPRWTGDANFMPIIGGTKVLPELLPATYAKLRAEVARQQSAATQVQVVLRSPQGDRLYLTDGLLPRIDLVPNLSVWKSVTDVLLPQADSLALIGWGGDASCLADSSAPISLLCTFTPANSASELQATMLEDVTPSETDMAVALDACHRFQLQ